MNSNNEEYIQQLTERIYLIKEKLDSGELKIAGNLWDAFIKSFEAVRLRADGLVDPDTVDGRLRAMGAGLHGFEERKNIKARFSIYQLQEAYFRILFNDFGGVYKMMMDGNSPPFHVAQFLSTQSEFVDSIFNNIDELYKTINEFWTTAADIGVFHLQDGNQLKATFAGDLFPSYAENSVSIAGLYIDTMILPCPILRIYILKDHMGREKFTELFMKHVLTCMTYRDVILEEVDTPIALILPHQSDISLDRKKQTFSTATPYLLRHAENMFGIHFYDIDDLEEYCSTLDTAESLLKALKKPNLMLFDSEWGNNATSQITNLIKGESDIKTNTTGAPIGTLALHNIIGRFPQAFAAMENAINLGGVPFINAQTSWMYYNWLLEYEKNIMNTDADSLKNTHIMHALSVENQSKISWLGNVPVQTVIDLRRRNMMGEVRDLLSSGINDLISHNGNNYIETTNRVIDNIDNTFRKHQLFIQRAKQDKLKLLGVDIGLMVVSGSIGLAAAYRGDPSLGVVSTAMGLYGLPNIKDIKSKWKEQKERMDTYRNSPVGLLFKHIKV